MTRECTQAACDRPHYAKGWCFPHYLRARRSGNMSTPVRMKQTDEQRFWQKVDRTTDCWKWLGTLNESGYGVVRNGGTNRLAHRVSYSFHHGTIPTGMHIDHKCHQRDCVNPDHLRLATSALNQQNRAGATRASKSGVRGVSWYKSSNKWVAKATLLGRTHTIGYFETIESAEEAVTSWRRTNMPYSLMDQRKVS